MATQTISIPSNGPLDKSLYRPGLRGEFGALLAVVRREWIIFRRYPSWIISLLVWPVIFPLVYIFMGRALAGPDNSGLARFYQNAGQMNFMGFIVIGTVIWMWQNMVLWDVGYSLRNEQTRGTLESSWLTPTWRFSYLLGGGLVGMFVMLLFLIVTGLEFNLLLGVSFDGNLFLLALILLAAIPSIYGLGFAFASLVITVKEANAFVFLVRGMVMIFCGITFPVGILPDWMQTVARFLPPTYVIHGARVAALTNVSFSQLLGDLYPLLGFGIVWLLIGYSLFNRMERRARQTGALAQF